MDWRDDDRGLGVHPVGSWMRLDAAHVYAQWKNAIFIRAESRWWPCYDEGIPWICNIKNILDIKIKWMKQRLLSFVWILLHYSTHSRFHTQTVLWLQPLAYSIPHTTFSKLSHCSSFYSAHNGASLDERERGKECHSLKWQHKTWAHSRFGNKPFLKKCRGTPSTQTRRWAYIRRREKNFISSVAGNWRCCCLFWNQSNSSKAQWSALNWERDFRILCYLFFLSLTLNTRR